MNLLEQGSDLCSSNLSQMLVCAYFQRVDWRGYARRLTELYRERRDAMLDTLAEFMPEETHWTCPEGGFFIWVTLLFYTDVTSVLPQAVDRNVAYVSGEGFYAGGEGKNYMRLNFSFAESEDIRRGRIPGHGRPGIKRSATKARPEEAIGMCGTLSLFASRNLS